MSYCTNCGKQTTKKVCPECGAKRNANHKFCEWCGEVINENTIVCTNCKESTKSSKGILKTILGVLLIIMALITELIILRILCVIIGVSLFPFVNRIIIEKTKGKKWIRNARTIIAGILLIVAFFGTPDAPHVVTNDEATKAAEIVFHKEYELKNEDSYVLNKSSVNIEDEAFEGDENLVLVTVTLDVSAENSFGGMVREDYVIELLYNYEEGEYYQYFSNTGNKLKID